jgi:hypothetical protein
VLEVEGCDGRLEQRRENVAAPRDPLELVARDVTGALGQPIAEPEILGDERAAGARDHVRPDLREPALGGVAEAVEDRAGDREFEHAVAQELEPLVRVGAVVRPARVLEDLLEASRRQLGDQPTELLRTFVVRAGER